MQYMGDVVEVSVSDWSVNVKCSISDVVSSSTCSTFIQNSGHGYVIGNSLGDSFVEVMTVSSVVLRSVVVSG